MVWLDLIPNGPKYPSMKYLWFLYEDLRNRKYGLGYILHIWVLGPLRKATAAYVSASAVLDSTITQRCHQKLPLPLPG